MKMKKKSFMTTRPLYSLLWILLLSLWADGLQAQTYTIYPIPQKETLGNGTVELTTQINFICESGVDQFTRNRAIEVFENAGYTLVTASAPSQSLTNLYLGINGSNGVADQYATDNNLPLSVFTTANNKFDAHLLQVNQLHPHGDIVVLGNSDGSAFYAFATLEQMFEQTDGNTLSQITFEDYSHTQFRGIVEGFYGYPYSMESRLSLFEFCKRFKMNVFIYGPKADPYHLGNWRDDYPTSVTEQQRRFGWITQEDLRQIGAKSQACHVQFIWAAHPGIENGISFTSTTTINTGVEDLMEKFHHMYDLGIRGFGVFIDDIFDNPPSGSKQAHLATRTQERLREEFPSQEAADKISPLFFIPTTYVYTSWTASTLSYLRNVDADVVIGFTGWEVFSTIEKATTDNMANCIGRNPLMWWNNPVNDNYVDRIYMRKVTAHWDIVDDGPINSLNSLVLNPMCQGQASKVALFGGADYAWNPTKFNDEENWLASFSHIAQPGDTEAAKALECFARFSDSVIEDEDMITLYNSFMSDYVEDSTLPTATTQLRTRLTELKNACTFIEGMQNSPVKDYQLMYQDIRPWNAKLKTLSTIALEAFDLLEMGDNISRAEAWEKYRNIRTLYTNLSSDPLYQVSALGGSGTQTSESLTEVKPGNSYLRPFVEFLLNTAGTDIPGEWPEKDQPQVITNIESSTTVSLSTTTSNYTLTGLYGLTLAPNEYIGIYFGDIKSINVSAISNLSANMALETSSNGKQWSEVQLPIEEQITSYIRLKNKSTSDVTLNFSSLSVGIVSNKIEEQPTVSTNMPAYESNTIDRVIDGSTSTFFWENQVQSVGDYILLTFPTSGARHEITLTFTGTDQLQGTGEVQISSDNRNWTCVAEFNNSDIAGNIFRCNANGRTARYVRFIITQSNTDKWMQVAEFTVKTAETFAQTTDNNNFKVSTLSDKDLTTGFQPGEAGYLQHDFIENINIESIEIYHNSVFSQGYPTISIYNGKEWIEKGELNSYATIVDTKDEEMVTSLKITWTANNMPNLYEILPIGTPYVESSKPDAIEEVVALQPIIYTHNNHLTVKAEQEIQSITLYDMTGRVVNRYEVNSRVSEIELTPNAPAILTIQVVDQSGNTFTQKIIQ